MKITKKEAEALVWTLGEVMDRVDEDSEDPTDPLWVVLTAGFSRQDIHDACDRLMKQAYSGTITGPFHGLENTLLQVSIENTSWINIYRTGDATADSPGHIEEALSTLRSLAAKLDKLGITVNFIPNE